MPTETCISIAQHKNSELLTNQTSADILFYFVGRLDGSDAVGGGGGPRFSSSSR